MLGFIVRYSLSIIVPRGKKVKNWQVLREDDGPQTTDDGRSLTIGGAGSLEGDGQWTIDNGLPPVVYIARFNKHISPIPLFLCKQNQYGHLHCG